MTLVLCNGKVIEIPPGRIKLSDAQNSIETITDLVQSSVLSDLPDISKLNFDGLKKVNTSKINKFLENFEVKLDSQVDKVIDALGKSKTQQPKIEAAKTKVKESIQQLSDAIIIGVSKLKELLSKMQPKRNEILWILF